MISRLPLAERLPRHRHCGCLSLRFGCIITALIIILYSILALSQCIAEMSTKPPHGDGAAAQWIYYITVICFLVISFSLSALMLLGVLKDMLFLIRPWVVWQSIQLAAATVLFVAGNAARLATSFDQTSLFLALAEFTIILIKFYMLTVVASYCRLLEERSEETERLKGIDKDTWYTDL